MKILHTSDWHLDAKLEQMPRAREHELFFDWLRTTISTEKVDALLVAGDIFDIPDPSNSAHRRYTEFLRNLFLDVKAGKSRCRNIIIIAGNHDSPAFLTATGPLMELLGMYVIAVPTENLRDMIIPLRDTDGKTRSLVAAAPYLRERHLGPWLEMRDEENRSAEILRAHSRFYRALTDAALAVREEILTEEGRPETEKIPIIATGHLFAAHGQTASDDKTRPIVGRLECFPASEFPEELDYVALGHLHLPQKVDGRADVQYSGSPIPLSFTELSRPKQVLILETLNESEINGENKPISVDFLNTKTKTVTENATVADTKTVTQKFRIQSLSIPRFQEMKEIQGDFSELKQVVQELADARENVWVKAIYTGETYDLDLRDKIEKLFNQHENVTLLKFENALSHRSRTTSEASQHEDLRQLSETEVFDRFLNTHYSELADPERDELRETFQLLLESYEIKKQEEAEKIEESDMVKEEVE
ncbi:MAG: exonuclease SbcCD subunit D C-terminal domain-containing protein [Planctomycetia bacterium]|nr:exonuclease SbcCD subunit D C-terminal domain-containing protein [Planctomycetia bacterium]